MARVVVLPRSRGEFSSEPLTFELEGRDLIKSAAKGLADHHKRTVAAGADPGTGGRQKALRQDGSAAKAARDGKRPNLRGSTEHQRFPKSIAWEIRGKHSVVAASVYFDWWLQREAKRGVEYFSVDGNADKALTKALQPVVDRMFR